jgi:hypothetical protein
MSIVRKAMCTRKDRKGNVVAEKEGSWAAPRLRGARKRSIAGLTPLLYLLSERISVYLCEVRKFA